jgi:hypothetical protein
VQDFSFKNQTISMKTNSSLYAEYIAKQIMCLEHISVSLENGDVSRAQDSLKDSIVNMHLFISLTRVSFGKHEWEVLEPLVQKLESLTSGVRLRMAKESYLD